MLRQMSIVMIVAGLSIVLVGSAWGEDHWGTVSDSVVYKVTVLEPGESPPEGYNGSVKEPELTFDGSRLYFNNAAGESEGGMQLFMADANDGDYGLEFLIDGDAMDNVNSSAGDMSPCVNSDESLLFFTSKRELNNQETWNIWVSFKSGGTWQAPIALSGDVNDCIDGTDCYSEIGPNFVDGDDWLYFASNRPYAEHTEQAHARLWIAILGLQANFNVDEDTTYHVLVNVNEEGMNQYAPELTYTGDSLYFTFHDPDIENNPENPHPEEAFIGEDDAFSYPLKIEDIYLPGYDFFEGPSIAYDDTNGDYYLYFHGRYTSGQSGTYFDTFRTAWIDEP